MDNVFSFPFTEHMTWYYLKVVCLLNSQVCNCKDWNRHVSGLVQMHAYLVLVSAFTHSSPNSFGCTGLKGFKSAVKVTARVCPLVAEQTMAGAETTITFVDLESNDWSKTHATIRASPLFMPSDASHSICPHTCVASQYERVFPEAHLDLVYSGLHSC